MADLTQEIAVSARTGLEVSATLGMATNDRYILTLVDGDSGDSLFMAETDDGALAPVTVGHLVARFNGRSTDPIRYRKRASVFVWFRTTRAPRDAGSFGNHLRSSDAPETEAP